MLDVLLWSILLDHLGDYTKMLLDLFQFLLRDAQVVSSQILVALGNLENKILAPVLGSADLFVDSLEYGVSDLSFTLWGEHVAIGFNHVALVSWRMFSSC